MTEPSRLAALPGYDTAPDVYETPDLTDATTIEQTSPRSEGVLGSSDEEEDTDYGVSRRRLSPSRAKDVFSATSSRVDTRGADLSDRIDGRRRGYRVRRRREGEVDEEDESLEARIARLRREIEECKVEADEQKAADDGEQATGGAEQLDGLGKLLAGIDAPADRDAQGVRQRPPTNNGTAVDDELSEDQLLARVSDFDARLASLEQVLGISSLDNATSDAVFAPLLPFLTLLDEQLTALTSATSLTSLEAASSRIQKLKHEAEDLSHYSETSEQVNGDTVEIPLLSPEDLSKLQQLYTLLPNLQALAPTVPAMLTRLRSLRTLHTGAANAAAELEEVERRQAEMDKELAAWKEGLEKVEEAVEDAQESNGKNARTVQGWVKDLEKRVEGLR